MGVSQSYPKSKLVISSPKLLLSMIEERKDILANDKTDEEFDYMLQKLMEERKERKRKKQSDMEM